jgi:glycerate-2-kinase
MSRRVTLVASLRALAREALSAVEGSRLVGASLGAAPVGDAVWVWAVGKAAPAMARGALAALGPRVVGGLVLTKEGCGAAPPLPTREAAHPFPDARGVVATEELLAQARALDDDVHALLLLSGGASALLAATVPGVSLDELQAATRALVLSGAAIGEINTVRRHLGAALGGRLARATRAQLDVLALSDVIGDDPAAIGSGPASPDPTTCAEAREVAARHGLAPSLAFAETPKPGDPAFARVRHRILASPTTLRDAAVAAAERAGWRASARAALLVGDVAAVVDEVAAQAAALAPGELWVAVGEPTVRVAGAGRGGRAQHLALLCARALAGREDLALLACGSDGSDGPTDVAGAVVDGTTWARGGPAAAAALADFDSHPLLARLGATVATGATGTNLTDLLLLARALTTAS